MTIRVILVPLDGSPADEAVLERAGFVAHRFGAHLTGLHVVRSSMESMARMSDRLSASRRGDLERRAEEDARTRADTVRSAFTAFCGRREIVLRDTPAVGDSASAQWLEETGAVADALVRRGRLSDVIVVSRPQPSNEDTVRRSLAGGNLESILMGTGRPLLIEPPIAESRLSAAPSARVAIGWNESQESARALSLAIPWLQQMDAVTLICSAQREAASAGVLDYLAWHGIGAAVELLADRRQTDASAILSCCRSVQADLLVVGGYSHSRARQLLFGGVTTDLLVSADLPVLMVH